MSSSDSASSRTPLPHGTVPVAAALLIAGIATFAFFRIGTNAVGGQEEFEPISSLWFATFALAPGFFLPLEQELARAIGQRRALGTGGRPVVSKVGRLGLVLGGLVALLILALSPIITESYFDGDWVMLAALVTAFVVYAPAHIARGICAGSGRFRSYAVIMGSDGVVRIILCVLLALAGIASTGAYGFAVALAPLFGLVLVYRKGALQTYPGPPATWGEVTPNLGWLLLGTVCAAMLLNAGPVITALLAEPEQDAEVTQFAYGVLLARVPLFMFQAVQAALLPRLSRLAAQDELTEFRSGLKQLLTLVLAVGVVGTVGAYVLGPWAIEIVYNADLTGRTLAMLAAGSACYMMALALAQAVIALKGHALVALGWVIGVVSLVLATWLSSDDLFRRVEWGLLISSGAAMIAFALALHHRLRIGSVPDESSLLEAITDMPLES